MPLVAPTLDQPLNLDCMSRAELLEAQKHLETLARYCRTKAEAMAYRQQGAINPALRLERICESLYETLPAGMRW